MQAVGEKELPAAVPSGARLDVERGRRDHIELRKHPEVRKQAAGAGRRRATLPPPLPDVC